MGDYVGADQGCLKEIRFDKVYLDQPLEKRERNIPSRRGKRK